MKKGFTLIELLVVVLIIGILAAIALPQYKKAVWKARLSEVKMFINAIEKAEQSYYLANSGYTGNMNDLDIDFTHMITEKGGNLYFKDFELAGLYLTPYDLDGRLQNNAYSLVYESDSYLFWLYIDMGPTWIRRTCDQKKGDMCKLIWAHSGGECTDAERNAGVWCR